jgi:predicted DNA-binding protein (MmcQ/YjbR family)
MNIEEFREYCLSKPGASEDFPFGEDTLVFKVGGKMFALTSLDGDFTANLKCDPEWAIELRETYPCVIPGYHMSKRHWNTIIFDGSIPDRLVCDWIDHSYELILQGLPRKIREELNK